MSVRLVPWRRGPSQFERAADGSMTLVEHLIELRGRLSKASLAILAGIAIGYWLADPVFELLKQPYCNLDTAFRPEGDCDLLVLGAQDPFLQRLKLALWVGLIIAGPVWLYQLWAFIAPGLHRHERRWAYTFGTIALPLFAAGALLAYVVVGRGLHFLLESGLNGSTQLEMGRYISFVTTLILVFGLSFQFPVLLLLLNFSGMVSARRLLKAWRIVVFVCFAFAAVFTPDPGPFGMTLLASCLSLLYFLSVGVAFLNDRRRAKRTGMYADLADDEISPLEQDLEPVAAGEPVEAITSVPPPEPVERRYDDVT